MKIGKLIFSFFLFVISFTPQNTFATTQYSETLTWNGKEYYLRDLPLYVNQELANAFHKIYHVKSPHTANIRGYEGFWSIKDDVLYLDSIQYYSSTNPKESGTMWGPTEQRTLIPDNEILFAPYKTEKGVRASWVTDTLHIGSGEVIRYDDFSILPTYEHETSLAFVNGCLTRTFHTEYKHISGDNIQSATTMIQSESLDEYFSRMLPKSKGKIVVKIHVESSYQLHVPGTAEVKIKSSSRCNSSTKRIIKKELTDHIPYYNFCCQHNINDYLFLNEAYVKIQLGKSGKAKQ